jgi:hypothetical protein
MLIYGRKEGKGGLSVEKTKVLNNLNVRYINLIIHRNIRKKYFLLREIQKGRNNVQEKMPLMDKFTVTYTVSSETITRNAVDSMRMFPGRTLLSFVAVAGILF